VDGDEEQDHRKGEGGDAEAMHLVPCGVLLEGFAGFGCVRRKLRQPVVDGDEEKQSENDNGGPDGDGCDEQRDLRLVAEEERLRDEEEKAQGIPEGHGEAEFRGKQADPGEPGAVVQFAEDGVDEGGDGEFGADHEADAENRGDVEEGCHGSLLGMRRGLPVY